MIFQGKGMIVYELPNITENGGDVYHYFMITLGDVGIRMGGGFTLTESSDDEDEEEDDDDLLEAGTTPTFSIVDDCAGTSFSPVSNSTKSTLFSSFLPIELFRNKNGKD